MNQQRSEALFREAQRYLPGGVDSPVRAFKAVGGTPKFIVRGKGSKIYDADGNEFIDYVCSWGPLILGHSPPSVVKILKKAIEQGTSYGAPTELEITLAKMISAAMPSIEMIRFVNSGTEATMSALRLARAFTNRDIIVKFDGGYHGHCDGLLVKAGSGVATLGIPGSPGVPSAYVTTTLTVPYNDAEAVERLFDHYPHDIAAVIVEPVAANMGVISPKNDFLNRLRNLTKHFGSLLIFDEVITGFRVAYGGAQYLYQIKPDITCLGKIIGGGLPVGAFGGKREIMEMMAPTGPVYQAGTLSGNPIAMTAGIETLKLLSNRDVYRQLEHKAVILEKRINSLSAQAGIDIQFSRVASLFTVFFSSSQVIDYESAKLSNTKAFNRFFHALSEEGIYWPPSQFEAAFLSLSHTDEDIQRTISTIDRAIHSLVE